MRPLTLTTPKPLLKIQGKPIIDYIFDALPEEIDEVIVTVWYLADKIKEYLGNEYKGRKIHYVEGSPAGNVVGFINSKPYFTKGERFLVLYGDEIQPKDEIEQALKHKYGWVCVPVKDPTSSGIATLDESKIIIEVVEKPKNPTSNLAAAGTIVVDTDIFKYEPIKHENGEYYLSSMMGQFIKDHPVHAIFGKPRPPTTSPEDLNWDMRDFQ